MTNQVRIFVSSTFADFERERHLLHEQIKPTLDEMSRHFGLDLELCDFRWGVTSADLAQDRTAALCLREIDICRHVSPEANFMVLLGDRAGSRVVPATVRRAALEHLCADILEAPESDPQPILQMVERLYVEDASLSAATLRLDTSESGTCLVEAFASDPTAARYLAALKCIDPAADELRRALALSITHREILRSGLLTERAPNRGAVALIRSRGEIDHAQSAMRRRVETMLGDRVPNLVAPADGEAGHADYESQFVRSCTNLLGDLVQEARLRGSRSHYFSELWRTEPFPTPAVSRHPAILAQLDRWAVGVPAHTAAIVGPPGSGRSDALEAVAGRLQTLFPDARIVLLSIGARADLENLARFATALIDALTDTQAEPDTSGRRADLIARAEAALRASEQDRPLFLLIDDLDRLDGDGLNSAAWLWAGATTRRVIFTVRDDVVIPAPIDVWTLPPLAPGELRACAADAVRSVDAEDLDVGEVMDVVTSGRPGEVYRYVRIATEASRAQRTQWAARGATGLIESALDDRIARAPFSKRICDLFLSLCLTPGAGVSDNEFLSICQDSPSIRSELERHFPHSRFLESVPRLVWHRLTEHFSAAVEEHYRAGGLAWCVRAEFAEAVGRTVGPAATQAVEALAELFLRDLERVTMRGVDVLPRLLAMLGRHDELVRLALTPAFMKQVVVTDRIDALLRAVGSAPSPSDLLADIVSGTDRVAGLSPKALSHWLLDLSVLARQLGFGPEGAELALRAYETRRTALGLDDGLSIAACLEAADSLLEARHGEKAEQLCSEMLAAIGARRAGSALVKRLQLNRAAALVYLSRFAEAEAVLRALLPDLESDAGGGAELMGLCNSLSTCCLERGSADEAEAYATQAVDVASRLMGRRSRDTAVIMVNLATIQLKRGLPDIASVTLEEVLSIYAESLDPAHPWVVNAEHAYFGALSGAGRVSDAVAFLISRLDRAQEFEAAAPWIILMAQALPAVAFDAEREPIRRLYQLIDVLVTSSPPEAWTGALVGRSMRILGAALGVAADDAKGLLITAIYLWILIAVSAVRVGIVRESEAHQHLSTLELRLGQLMGEPAPLPRDGRIEDVWRLFTRQEWPVEARLLLKLAPTRDAGLIDAFKALAGRAASLVSLRARVDAAKAENEGDSDDAGQALIMFAARAAAAGDFASAIAAQTEAAAMAGKLFGSDSTQRAMAILNLGSLQFRAQEFSEAFDAYREGLDHLYGDPLTADRFGQALANAMHAGLEAGRFAETGRLMEMLAGRSGTCPAGINLGGMAGVAFLRGGMSQKAFDAFTPALTVYRNMDPRERGAWVEPVTAIATMLFGGLDAPQKLLLAKSILKLESEAETGGWGATLSAHPAWRRLVSELKADEGRRDST